MSHQGTFSPIRIYRFIRDTCQHAGLRSSPSLAVFTIDQIVSDLGSYVAPQKLQYFLSSLSVRIALLRPNPLIFNVQFEYTTLQFF